RRGVGVGTLVPARRRGDPFLVPEAAAADDLRRGLAGIVLGTPLADVAHHVVAAGRAHAGTGADGRREFVAVGPARRIAPLLIQVPVVAPRIGPARLAARGLLPLALGGQSLAGPRRVRVRVVPRDAHDRMLRAVVD